MSDTLRRTLGALLLIATMGGSTLGALLRVDAPRASYVPVDMTPTTLLPTAAHGARRS